MQTGVRSARKKGRPVLAQATSSRSQGESAIEVPLARRLCGRLGADYGFVLSLILVSYGQQFTGYHRTAINFGYLAW